MSQMYTLLVVLLILMSNKPSECAKKRGVKALLWENVETNYGAYYCDNYTATITNHRHDLNMDIYTKVNVTNFSLALNIWYKDPKTLIERSLFAYNVNICSLLGSKIGKVNIMTTWLKNLEKYSNMPHTCSWKKGHYYWRKLKPDKDSIPSFVQSGHYRIAAKFHFPNKENQLFTNTSMSVIIRMQ